MVNSMLSYSRLSEGFWGEAMLTACYLLNRVPNKNNKITPYELWYKKQPNLSYLHVWGCRAVVRLPEPKKKNLGEKGIDCIFIGYAEHSKAYRFYDPKEHTIVSSSLMELKRWRDLPVEGSRDEIASQYSYCYSIEEDPKTFDEAMKSRDVSFWKKAVDDEIGSIMENNT
ncbi:zinc finger, CCHC-type containing protein [Tanacetum coccineum]